MSLENEVRAALAVAGFEEVDGEYVAARGNGRTRIRATAADAADYARRFGVDALGSFLGAQTRRLERDSDRNRFRERRLGGAIAKVLEDRAARMGGIKPRIEVSGRSPGPGADVGEVDLPPGARPGERSAVIHLEGEALTPGAFEEAVDALTDSDLISSAVAERGLVPTVDSPEVKPFHREFERFIGSDLPDPEADALTPGAFEDAVESFEKAAIIQVNS